MGPSVPNKQKDDLDMTFEDMLEEEEEGDLGFNFYKDDELEDLVSNSKAESYSIFSGFTDPEQMIKRFNVHKKQKELLKDDLQDTIDKRPRRG